MHLFFGPFCLPVLLLCPILYPPIATFTALFFLKINKWYISIALIFSSAIISSLISATIVPYSDTEIYLNSFAQIRSFDFTQLKLDNNGFEPLYKVYEYVLSIFIGNNQKLFLLLTALIYNITSTLAILKICNRLKQRELACVIFAVYYSLVPPALGTSIFLLRSGLSLSIALLGISFYKEKPIIAYSLGVLATFIHSFSLIFLVAMIVQDWLKLFTNKIYSQTSLSLKSLMDTLFLRFYLIILISGCVMLILVPDSLSSTSQAFLSAIGNIDEVTSSKAGSFLDTKPENFVDFLNPVFIIQVVFSLLCFCKLQIPTINNSNQDRISDEKIFNLLELLRLIGRWQIIVIIMTGPFGLFPYRIGLFNFLYFPIWIVNIPYLAITKIHWKKYITHLTVFASMAVFTYVFYWMPKRQGMESDLVILEGKPLSHNIAQVFSYFFN